MSEPSSPVSIHLIDDDSETLLFLFDLLNNSGFWVSASSSASDALGVIARSRPQVAVCDSELPDIGGLELIRRVKAASPGTQVVLLARKGGLELEEVLREGGLDVVFKPFRPQEVLQAVERIFGGMGSGVAALHSEKEEIR